LFHPASRATAQWHWRDEAAGAKVDGWKGDIREEACPMTLQHSRPAEAHIAVDATRILLFAAVVIGLLATATALFGFNPPWLPTMDFVPDPAGPLPF
jgi:hypothetical protein